MDYELMMNGNVKIGQKAPDFDAITTYGNKKMSDYKGRWLVFFSHPGDFTPVCTTEMIAFAKVYPYFKKLNTELLGLSIDSNPSHLAWMYDIYCRTGIVLPFPIIADRSGEIARRYGMIASDISNTETVRNVYIDPIRGRRIVFDTIHAVKGATFDAVLLFLSEDSLGQRISFNDFPRDEIVTMTEKQRLIYVACSRATQFLAFAVPTTVSDATISSTLRGIELDIRLVNLQGELALV